MKNWKKAIALVASAAALVSVAACGPSNAGGSSDSGKKTVGFVAVGPEGGFRTANEKDIQKAFEDAGFDLTYSPTQNNDQQKQIQAFNKFVNDEVDAIILSSTEDSGWDDSLKKAAEAEIPVFTVDRNVDVKDAEAKKAIVAHIGPSNVWCGEQAAEFVNKNFPDGANGFILEGPAGLSVVKDRGTGWGNKVASNVKVLESQSANWSTDEAKTVTLVCSTSTSPTTRSSSSLRTTRWASVPLRLLTPPASRARSRSSPSTVPRTLCRLLLMVTSPT